MAGIVSGEAFSRGVFFDPDWMGWGVLRVLSRQCWAAGAIRDEGRVANIERLLLVLEGGLDADCGDLGRHRVEAGGALWIGTGHGVSARFANASADTPLRLLECWIQPDRVNAAPAVDHLPKLSPTDGWSIVAAPAGSTASDSTADPDPRERILPLRQQAWLLSARVEAGAVLAIAQGDSGRCWLEVLQGTVAVVPGHGGRSGNDLAPGDGLAWHAAGDGAPSAIRNTGAGPAWLLLLRLPA